MEPTKTGRTTTRTTVGLSTTLNLNRSRRDGSFTRGPHTGTAGRGDFETAKEWRGYGGVLSGAPPCPGTGGYRGLVVRADHADPIDGATTRSPRRYLSPSADLHVSRVANSAICQRVGSTTAAIPGWSGFDRKTSCGPSRSGFIIPAATTILGAGSRGSI